MQPKHFKRFHCLICTIIMCTTPACSHYSIPNNLLNYYENTCEKTVIVANPRNKGEQEYVTYDEKGQVFSLGGGTGTLRYDYIVNGIILAKTNGSFILPLFPVTKTRYSKVGGEPFDIKTIGNPQFTLDLEREKILAPIGKDISGYFFLISSKTEDSGWRYIEIDKSVIENPVNSIHIPDILSLPRADSRPDFDILWKMYEDALKIYECECSKLPGTNKW